MLPTFFLAHGGGPMPLMGDPPADFLKSIPSFLTQAEIKSVKSILIVSAHWEETTVTVSSSPKPAMLFDYYGFPRYTYEYKYDAPGNPELAKRIQNLCNNAQIPCNLDDKRGFDHATFVPLLLAYPEAKIPVVQMSLQKDLDPSFHIALGEALAPLRDEVLIMGSGFSFHNLPALLSRINSNAVMKKSEKFDTWLQSTMLQNEYDKTKKALIGWKKNAPEALYAHPREEHLVPLFVAFGASKDSSTVLSIYNDFVLHAKVSAFMFR